MHASRRSTVHIHSAPRSGCDIPGFGNMSPGPVRKEDTTCLEETKEITETKETKEKARP